MEAWDPRGERERERDEANKAHKKKSEYQYDVLRAEAGQEEQEQPCRDRSVGTGTGGAAAPAELAVADRGAAEQAAGGGRGVAGVDDHGLLLLSLELLPLRTRSIRSLSPLLLKRAACVLTMCACAC